MIKNLYINYLDSFNVSKIVFHKLVGILKRKLRFKISSLTINFISQEQILDINKKYLNHNFTTDIITFNYSGSNNNLDGEIFISVNDAKENASIFNENENDEFIRLIIHGILHLLGYDDQNESDKKEMKTIENKLVEDFNYNFLLEG